MTLLDENGNLFGVVNVVDAVVIVLVLGVLVAGAAFLLDDGEPDTRYATVELGSQPGYVVDRIEAGDVASFSGTDHNLTVRDVYVTPPEDGQNESRPLVTIRAQINGEIREDASGRNTFHLAGEPLLPGTAVEVDTGSYVAEGEVTDLGSAEPTLPIEETSVLLETTVTDTTANEMAAGDTIAVGPHTVGTVTTVRLYPTGDDQQHALVGADLVTLEDATAQLYAGQPITIGRQLQLQTGRYDLTADVIRRGTATQRGERTTTDAEIEVRNVDAAIADGLEAGMTETVRNETLARVTSVEDDPAAVVLESEDGDIYEREHPQNRDVTLSVELRTRDTDTGLRFQGERLREGTTVVLDLDRVLVEGTVTGLR